MKSSHTDLVAGLADRFGPMVFATAYRLLGNRDEANDAYQEVFLKLMKARTLDISVDQADQWGAYLRVVASRCAINILHRRPQWEPLDEDLLERLESPGGENPHAQVEQSQRAELLRRGLRALSERDAHIFALRHFEGLSYEEIARQEELTVNAVGVVLHRATQRLKQFIESIVSPNAQAGAAPIPSRANLVQEENHD